jgi:hypothetical protein
MDLRFRGNNIASVIIGLDPINQKSQDYIRHRVGSWIPACAGMTSPPVIIGLDPINQKSQG